MLTATAGKTSGGNSIFEQSPSRHRHPFGNHQRREPDGSRQRENLPQSVRPLHHVRRDGDEIIRGYERKQATRQLQAFLAAIPTAEVLSFDTAEAKLAGRIAGELERTGRPIGTADTMIAATAIESGLELATGNTADFQRVQQLGYPLTLVNWR